MLFAEDDPNVKVALGLCDDLGIKTTQIWAIFGKMLYKMDNSVVFTGPVVTDDLNECILFQFSLNSGLSAQSY